MFHLAIIVLLLGRQTLRCHARGSRESLGATRPSLAPTFKRRESVRRLAENKTIPCMKESSGRLPVAISCSFCFVTLFKLWRKNIITPQLQKPLLLQFSRELCNIIRMELDIVKIFFLSHGPNVEIAPGWITRTTCLKSPLVRYLLTVVKLHFSWSKAAISLASSIR